jgi:hypothetical protein
VSCIDHRTQGLHLEFMVVHLEQLAPYLTKGAAGAVGE